MTLGKRNLRVCTVYIQFCFTLLRQNFNLFRCWWQLNKNISITRKMGLQHIIAQIVQLTVCKRLIVSITVATNTRWPRSLHSVSLGFLASSFHLFCAASFRHHSCTVISLWRCQPLKPGALVSSWTDCWLLKWFYYSTGWKSYVCDHIHKVTILFTWILTWTFSNHSICPADTQSVYIRKLYCTNDKHLLCLYDE